MHRRRLLCCGLILSLLAGCAPKRDEKARLHYAERLEPEVGQATVEQYVKEWGTPTQRIPLTDGTIYCWRISHGARSGGFAYILAIGESYERYDDIRLTFDNNQILREWNVDCVR